MKKIIYTFLLIITFLIICNFAFLSCSKKNVSDTSNPNVIDSNVNSKFEINILSNKNEYYQLEPVWMTIQIKNTSPNVDSIDIHDNIELLPGFRVTDKNGNELIYHYNLGLYGRPNFIKINGNGQISFDVELSMGFGENNLGEHLRAKYYPITYFSKGKYSVTLHYRKALNKEMLQSNKINFEVKLPENDELKVFKKLLEINKTYDYELISWENYIDDLNKLYDENQNSIYSEEIYYNFIHITLLAQGNMFNEKLVGKCKVFLNKYPNSFYSEKIINALLPPYVSTLNKSKQDVINFLNELMNKNPNTKIQNVALKYMRDNKYIH